MNTFGPSVFAEFCFNGKFSRRYLWLLIFSLLFVFDISIKKVDVGNRSLELIFEAGNAYRWRLCCEEKRFFTAKKSALRLSKDDSLLNRRIDYVLVSEYVFEAQQVDSKS